MITIKSVFITGSGSVCLTSDGEFRLGDSATSELVTSAKQVSDQPDYVRGMVVKWLKDKAIGLEPDVAPVVEPVVVPVTAGDKPTNKVVK